MAKKPNKLLFWRNRKAIVPVIRLHGAIGAVTPLRPGLTIHQINPVLEKAFAISKAKAIALTINSPGGSPVQSAQIYHRIRQLADKEDKRVLVFTEDVAASGGYMLALAGDEIYADPSSIIGSIGVVSAGFGFVEAIKKLGIERRVHTAGENKSILDPFSPEKEVDVDRLKQMQLEVHEHFKDMVKERRGAKLDETDKDLFSGAFWSGVKAQNLGLVDGIGNMHTVLREKFGDEVVLKTISAPRKGMLSRLMPGGMEERMFGDAGDLSKSGLTDELVSSLEARTIWSRFGI